MRIKVYQIYYRRFQRKFLLEGFIPYFNEIADIYLESGIICDLVGQGECSDCDWFGVFSWKVDRKIRGFNFERLQNGVRKRGKYDILAPKRKGKFGRPHKHSYTYRGVKTGFEIILQKLLEQSVIPYIPSFDKEELCIYSNYFIARREVYIDFVTTLLRPAIDLIVTDEELYEVLRELVDYPTPETFTEQTGFEKFPAIPFVLERLINVYVRINDRRMAMI